MKYIFEYCGGSRDGQRDEGQLAMGMFAMTDNGTVGKQIKGIQPHTLALVESLTREHGKPTAPESVKREIYEVFERSESDDQIVVRCKFIEYTD